MQSIVSILTTPWINHFDVITSLGNLEHYKDQLAMLPARTIMDMLSGTSRALNEGLSWN